MSLPAEKPVGAKNGTAPSENKQSSAIDKLLIANTTLAIWLIFLTFGGGILTLYYSRIGYLPDIEWKATLIYLFIGSMVGGVIGLLLTISLYLPGIIWSELIVFDASLNKCLSYTLDSAEASSKALPHKEPCIRSIITYLGVPFLVVLLFSHLALLLPRVPVKSQGQYIDLYWGGRHYPAVPDVLRNANALSTHGPIM